MANKGEIASLDATESMVVAAPIVVDLGKVRGRQIKRLKRGEGKLLEEIGDVMERVRASLGADAAGKELVPVVILYRKKRRRGSSFAFPFG